jgi:hypothetical protein
MAMPIELAGVPARDGWVEADLDRLPDDGNRYELIDGSLHVTPPPPTSTTRSVPISARS